MAGSKASFAFGQIVATIGTVLIALGVLWLIAQNWHWMNPALKIAILAAATGSAYVSGAVFRIRKYPRIGESLLLLGGILYSCSIFLIAQIFSAYPSVQGTAFLLLICWVGLIVLSYILISGSNLILGLLGFLAWTFTQYLALVENLDNPPSAMLLIIMFLITGVLLYGLGLLHRRKSHKFTRIYLFFTTIYLLLYSYLLSFQLIISTIGAKMPLTIGEFAFLVIMAVISLMVAITGLTYALKEKKIRKNEAWAFCIIVIFFAALILLSWAGTADIGNCYVKNCYNLRDKATCNTIDLPYQSCLWNDEGNYCAGVDCYAYSLNKTLCDSAPARLGCKWRQNNNSFDTGCRPIDEKAMMPQSQYSDACSNFTAQKACEAENICRWQQGYESWRNKAVPISLWLLWIFANIMLIATILLVIGYGTVNRIPAIINIGIGAFVLDVITRYIGFLMDLWGYTSLSVIFITGGLLLLVGGWLVEKWRRGLIEKAMRRRR